MELMKRAAPYADRILEIADLDTHQASAVAPEDAGEGPPEHIDFDADKLFASARAQKLTTFPVPKWDARVVIRDSGVDFPG